MLLIANDDEFIQKRNANLCETIWKTEKMLLNSSSPKRRSITGYGRWHRCCRAWRASNPPNRWLISRTKWYILAPSVETVIVGSCQAIRIGKPLEKPGTKDSGKASPKHLVSRPAYWLWKFRLTVEKKFRSTVKLILRLEMTVREIFRLAFENGESPRSDLVCGRQK